MKYDTSNSIENLLNLADDSVIVTEVHHTGNTIIATVEKKYKDNICSECQSIMHSKGSRFRTVSHPIFQDGRVLILNVKTTKWHCLCCNSYHYDQFSFVGKNHRNSNLTILMMLDKLKELRYTAALVAKELNVSDTFVHDTFLKYVDLPRLPLGEVLAIDEVYLKFNTDNKYPVVLLDWQSGEIIDIIQNRYTETLRRYFLNIPLSERKQVKYIVSDMYDTYTSLAGSLFPNAISVIDCFHHTSPLISMINIYINNVSKKYKKRDYERLKQQNYKNNTNNKTIKESREVMLLRKYSFLLLKNHDEINYEPFFNERYKRWFDLSRIENEFMALDKNFPRIRELKEMYITFTHSFENDFDGAKEELDRIIEIYSSCEIYLFRDFSLMLKRQYQGIINSFAFLKCNRKSNSNITMARISNGIMESYNNIPKDLKRQSNGVSNFPYTRNRLLWAGRTNPSILLVPKTDEEIHTPGKPRGPYKKP